MNIYRLDATHNTGDGAFVKFFADLDAARRADARFAEFGWLCDFYPVDISMSPSVALLLCSGVWPNDDMRTLLLLAGNSVTRAKADLDQIVELKHQHQRRRNAK